MSFSTNMVNNVTDVWIKLNAKWQGEHADAFYNDYIVRISETVEEYDKACAEVRLLSAEFNNALEALEQSLSEE